MFLRDSLFYYVQVILYCPLDSFSYIETVPNIIIRYPILLKYVSVLKCPAPTWSVTQGTFDCNGRETNWDGVCNLNCDSNNGYKGDEEIKCVVDTNAGVDAVDWDSEPTCTCKPIFILCALNVMNLE